jgi:hypothetical protein
MALKPLSAAFTAGKSEKLMARAAAAALSARIFSSQPASPAFAAGLENATKLPVPIHEDEDRAVHKQVHGESRSAAGSRPPASGCSPRNR